MKYRELKKLDVKLSALGFGAMRLPTIDADIDEKEAIRMIRHAIDNGINYIDTAYFYHDGKSEVVVGKALKDGYREKVYLATKCPVILIKEEGDFDKYLDEQLKRLNTNSIDFYLLHALNINSWNNIVLKFNLLKKAEDARKAGKIKFIGFSFHDDYASFQKIIDARDWDFCQIQYNYMDIDNQAGEKGLKYAASKGIPVIVMEPILGGRLANPPETIKKILKQSKIKRSPADFALQWVWNHEEVSMILSGMSTMDQLKENIDSAEKSGINSLSQEDLGIIKKVREKYKSMIPIACTKCLYCQPCPNGVCIPRIFELYNNGFIYGDMKKSLEVYSRFIPEKERAKNCTQCKICEKKCPQKIEISRLMLKMKEVFDEEN